MNCFEIFMIRNQTWFSEYAETLPESNLWNMHMKRQCEYRAEEVPDSGLRWNEGGVLNPVLTRISKIDDFLKHLLTVSDNE